jgi:hypothetical protein
MASYLNTHRYNSRPEIRSRVPPGVSRTLRIIYTFCKENGTLLPDVFVNFILSRRGVTIRRGLNWLFRSITLIHSTRNYK